VLQLSGDYVQQLSGSLEFDIGGTEAGINQSQVIVTGNARLNGSIGVIGRIKTGHLWALQNRPV